MLWVFDVQVLHSNVDDDFQFVMANYISHVGQTIIFTLYQSERYRSRFFAIRFHLNELHEYGTSTVH